MALFGTQPELPVVFAAELSLISESDLQHQSTRQALSGPPALLAWNV